MRDRSTRRSGVVLTGGADAVTAIAASFLGAGRGPVDLAPLDGIPIDDVPDRLRPEAAAAGAALPKLRRPGDLADAGIVVLADVPERTTPLALRAALRLADELSAKAPHAWLLVVACPDHLLAPAAGGRFGRRVMGMGAFAESESLAARVASTLDVFRGDVEATVLGGPGSRRVVPRGLLRVGGIPAEELMERRVLERLLAAPSAPAPPPPAVGARWVLRAHRALTSGRRDAFLAHVALPGDRWGTAMVVPEADGPRPVPLPLSSEEARALEASLAALHEERHAHGIR